MGSNPIPTSLVSSHSGLVHRLGKSAGSGLASSNLALTSGVPVLFGSTPRTRWNDGGEVQAGGTPLGRLARVD